MTRADAGIGGTWAVDATSGDVDVEAPSAPIVVSVSDETVFELQLLFTRT